MDLEQFDGIDFDMPILAEALEEIKATKLNLIRCSLTAYPYGQMLDEEVTLCLRSELQSNPFMEKNELIRRFTLRRDVLSSGPAPSLRVHRDRSTLVNNLRSETNGPAKLFSYMVGRLLFESAIPLKDRFSLSTHIERMAFLIPLNSHIETLGNGWELKDKSVEALCFEAMLRIDAVFNLNSSYRFGVYAKELIALSRKPFSVELLTQLLDLLNRMEDESLLKIKTGPTPAGNVLIISAAMHILKQKANSKRSQAFKDQVYDLTTRGKLTSVSVAGQLLNNIQTILSTIEYSGAISKLERQRLAASVNQFSASINGMSYTDKRLDEMKRINARVATLDGGKVIKHTGEVAVKELDRLYGRKPLPKKSNPSAPKKSKLTPEQLAKFDDLFNTFKDLPGAE